MGSLQAESGNKISPCPTVEEVKVGAWRICRIVASEPHIFVRARTAHDARHFDDDVSTQSLDAVFHSAEQLRFLKVLVIITKGSQLKMDASKLKICYVITEKNGKSYFNRIGVAFVNSDGSLNVKLEAVPVNGEIHIRDYVPKGESFQPSLSTSGEVETTSDKDLDDVPFR